MDKSKPKRVPERNKISGLAYAYTDNGIELAVLDITHPLFVASIDEKALPALYDDFVRRAARIKKVPGWIKQFFIRRSYILGGLNIHDSHEAYLSAMSTLVAKLGPHLIGRGPRRFVDRKASQALFAVAMRMRLREICRLQIAALMPQLEAAPGETLCFVNIAGGAASDSINTLFLILKQEPRLLRGRKIEINVLDKESFAPNFARQCIEALRAEGRPFHDLEISFNHISYNWSDTARLADLLSARKGSVMICTSEGGLFSYGSDQDIVENLNILHAHSPDTLQIVGDVLQGANAVHPALTELMQLTNIKTRFIGAGGLKSILKNTCWDLENLVDSTPFYEVFTLKKGP